MTTEKTIKVVINADTKLFDILEAYPELEEYIMGLAPPFKNLRKPILRKTIGKLATIEKVAKIGGMKTIELVNNLREKVGQPLLADEATEIDMPARTLPEWLKGEPVTIINGIELLEQGIHPLNSVNLELSKLNKGQFILLVTNFLPIPLIDAMENAGHKVFTIEEENNVYKNYILK